MRSMRFTLLSIALFFALSFSVHAQIPTSGLVAYYPFNGDADDESGTGNDGTVYGATLTSDRFGNSNSAYSFDGSDYIEVPDNSSIEPTLEFTISAWAYIEDFTSRSHILTKRLNVSSVPYNSYGLLISSGSSPVWEAASSNASAFKGSNAIQKGKWYHLALVYDGSYLTLYVNGSVEATTTATGSISYNTNPLLIGSAAKLSGQYMYGKVDDIRIYDNALSYSNIIKLYQEGADKVTITKEPATRKVEAGDTASFSVSSTGTMLTYKWQVEKNNVFEDIAMICPYDLALPKMLRINPVGKNMFNIKYRVIVYNGAKSDTSNSVMLLMDTPSITTYDTVTVHDTTHVYDTTHITVYDTTHVNVYDTTHVTIYDTTHVVVHDTLRVIVYDTTFIKVTDTLVIDAVLAIGPPATRNTLKVYPNPAKDHISIDNGDYALMDYYSIEIRNVLGQKVFHEFIDQQQFYIDLSGWTGKGVYFLKLNDKSNKTIEVRKIIIQ